MKHLTFDQFKLTPGKWGFIAIEIPDESLVGKRPDDVAKALLGEFYKKAEEQHGILVKGSMHTYSDHDKAMFGLSEKPGHSTFVMYLVGS